LNYENKNLYYNKIQSFLLNKYIGSIPMVSFMKNNGNSAACREIIL
jgi:hypothetical protein